MLRFNFLMCDAQRFRLDIAVHDKNEFEVHQEYRTILQTERAPS